MEEKPINVVVAAEDTQNQSINVNKKKKQRFSLFNAAMLMLRSTGNEKPKAAKPLKIPNNKSNIPSNDKWKKLVGSMRPLHLQDDIQSPPPQNLALITPTSDIDSSFPNSPSSSSWCTASHYASANNLQELAGYGSSAGIYKSQSAGNLLELSGTGSMPKSMSMVNLRRASGSCMSQYASAINLLELDGDDDDDEEEDEEASDKKLENCAADVMIDTKADEFIAQFYEQMRCQEKGKDD